MATRSLRNFAFCSYNGRCSKMQLLQRRLCISPVQYRAQATNANVLTLQHYQLREELERNQSKCQSTFVSAKFALFNGNKPYMTKTNHGTLIMAKLDYQEAQKFINMEVDGQNGSNFAFLGLYGNNPFFAIDISQCSPGGLNSLDEIKVSQPGKFYSSMKSLSAIENSESSLFLKALSLIHFHKTILYCSRCGNQTHRHFNGSRRYCMNCRATFYPQVAPVISALVIRDGSCLLARQSTFPNGLYSALAGFCEPGESLEECARREVAEEIGLLSETVKFQGTQGWTRGIGDTSLMIGCYVTVNPSDEINMDKRELEDARWFTIEDIRKLISCTPKPININGVSVFVPPPVAIAHQLLLEWAK